MPCGMIQQISTGGAERSSVWAFARSNPENQTMKQSTRVVCTSRPSQPFAATHLVPYRQIQTLSRIFVTAVKGDRKGASSSARNTPLLSCPRAIPSNTDPGTYLRDCEQRRALGASCSTHKTPLYNNPAPIRSLYVYRDLMGAGLLHLEVLRQLSEVPGHFLRSPQTFL
jgi:hypothetical protein